MTEGPCNTQLSNQAVQRGFWAQVRINVTTALVVASILGLVGLVIDAIF
jgi:hypothetical protein